ncbi:hypothetical protein DITRI_Ditri08aG0149400 [Diplodiscus trichospermus]
MYQFSDFDWPSSVTEEFPNRHQVLDYVESYAKHFDLLKHIKFNTEVAGIEYEDPLDEEMKAWSLWGGNGVPFSAKGKWKVTVEDLKTLSTEWFAQDSRIFPPNKGPEAFHGEVIHSMDYAAMDDEKAAEFIKANESLLLGSRNLRWTLQWSALL